MRRAIQFLFTVFINLCAFAQNNTVALDEVVLSDVKLAHEFDDQFVEQISDSVLNRNQSLLSSLIKFNSPFFIRENGYGMVASASVRGTSASQTAVIWNGININSPLNGQTDFNTINTGSYDRISLKPGGGSVIYGSGAVGGTIHLNNQLNFVNGMEHFARLGYGSFNTQNGNYRGNYSNGQTSLHINLAGITSENNYPYDDAESNNKNGDFYNYTLNMSAGHYLNKTNIIRFYSHYYDGSRGFSGTIYTPSKSKYEDRNIRNMLEWKSFLGNFTSSLKLAHLEEEYNYYENRNSEIFDFGNAKTNIAKYELQHEFGNNSKLGFIGDYTFLQGEGTGIGNVTRKIAGASLRFNQELERLFYQVGVRAESTSDFKTPILFSGGAKYQLSETFSPRFNFSKNYRIPTLNDLFWNSGGNANLKPENSLQFEAGTDINFGELELRMTGFFMDMDNYLRWIPDASGVWSPKNTSEVNNYGFEFFSEWNTELFQNSFQLKSNYSYTKSIDQKNDNQLIYVPFHKAGLSAAYQVKSFLFNFQDMYSGDIFTSGDNNYSLSGYNLANFGVEYDAWEKLALRVDINNIFNENYESLPFRQMPGISFNTSIFIKI